MSLAIGCLFINKFNQMKKKDKKPIDSVIIGTRVGCLGIVLFAIIWTALLVKLFISLI